MSVHSSLELWVDKVYLIIINRPTCQHGKGPHKKKTHYSDVTERMQAPPGQVSPRAVLGERLSHVPGNVTPRVGTTPRSKTCVVPTRGVTPIY